MATELFERIRECGVTDPQAGELIHDEAAVRELLGSCFQYSQPIEAEVPESFALVKALMPRMSEPDATFFSLWLWQEQGHAVSQKSVLDRLDLEPGPEMQKATPLARLLGIISNATPGLGDAIEVGVLTYMALGEEETTTAYRNEARLLTEKGEYELARVMGRMAHQESLHEEYQSTEAKLRYQELNDWQQRLVRAFIESHYRPVGVGRKNFARMSGFGNMLITVTNDQGQNLARTIQRLANEIVGIKPTSPFIARRYRECLDQLESDVP